MRRKLLLHALKLTVTAAILYLIFERFQIGFGDIAAAFGHRPAWFGAALLAQVGAISLSILRWRVLLRGQALEVPFGHVVKTFLVGRFLGTFTPTGVGLEAYKAYDIARYTGRAEASVSVVLVEKLIGTFFSLGLLVLASLPFFAGAIDRRFLALFGAVFVVLFAIALVLLFAPGALRVVLRAPGLRAERVRRSVERLVDGLSVYSRRRRSLLAAVGLGIGVYLLWFSTYYANSLALGAGLSLADVLKVGPLTQVATMLPLSIAGIGLREGAFMGLLDLLGLVPASDPGARAAMLLSATLVYFASVSLNLVGAVIFLTRRTDYRRQVEQLRRQAGG